MRSQTIARANNAILDRDSKFSSEVLELLKSSGIEPVRTSIRSPWQNGVAERWVGTARRDYFDHVIALNEAHVRRLGREFIAYYHEDRTHLGLDKDSPSKRPVEVKPAGAELQSLPRVGGLHHRYIWKRPPEFAANSTDVDRLIATGAFVLADFRFGQTRFVAYGASGRTPIANRGETSDPKQGLRQIRFGPSFGEPQHFPESGSKLAGRLPWCLSFSRLKSRPTTRRLGRQQARYVRHCEAKPL